MTLSVVIPTLDEANQVVEAIESARAPGVEVVVVDGGSVDATRERAAAAGARVLESPAGRSRQLAAGAAATHGDTVLFLHADTRLPSGYEVEVASVLTDSETVGGAFRFRFDERGFALALVEWGARLRVALFAMPYGDQGVFVRRRILDRIGGVPQVSIMEDLDLVRAMSLHGEVAAIPSPAVTSARRYLEAGVGRTVFRHWIALGAWMLGVDRDRIAAWVRR